MEVKRFATCVGIEHEADVGAVRRHAALLANTVGLDETKIGEVALLATELATNVLKHATRGGALIYPVSVPSSRGVGLAVWDRGPGMRLSDSMRDGVSTAGTRGVGLGAVARIATEWDAYSRPGLGTIVVTRVLGSARARSTTFAVGGVCVPIPGEDIPGDRWEAHLDGDVATIFVCDGLGHGRGAADAAAAACAAFVADPSAAPVAILERAHHAARPTRGAAATVVRIDRKQHHLTVCGVGNVTPWLHSGTFRQLVVQHGTIGQHVPRLHEEVYPFQDGDTVIITSDGLRSRWSATLEPEILSHDADVIAAALWRDYSRGKDDATVVVVRGVV